MLKLDKSGKLLEPATRSELVAELERLHTVITYARAKLFHYSPLDAYLVDEKRQSDRSAFEEDEAGEI